VDRKTGAAIPLGEECGLAAVLLIVREDPAGGYFDVTSGIFVKKGFINSGDTAKKVSGNCLDHPFRFVLPIPPLETINRPPSGFRCRLKGVMDRNESGGQSAVEKIRKTMKSVCSLAAPAGSA
jgi:hypothetical protein